MLLVYKAKRQKQALSGTRYKLLNLNIHLCFLLLLSQKSIIVPTILSVFLLTLSSKLFLIKGYTHTHNSNVLYSIFAFLKNYYYTLIYLRKDGEKLF